MPPSANTIKVNVDEAAKSSSLVRFGFVAHGNVGPVLASVSSKHHGTLSMALAEALCSIWKYKFLWSLGFMT